MAQKKKPEPAPFTLEVASVAVQVQVLVRNTEGKVADARNATVTIMSADLDKHTLPGIAAEVERQLTEQILNPTKVEK